MMEPKYTKNAELSRRSNILGSFILAVLLENQPSQQNAVPAVKHTKKSSSPSVLPTATQKIARRKVKDEQGGLLNESSSLAVPKTLVCSPADDNSNGDTEKTLPYEEVCKPFPCPFGS